MEVEAASEDVPAAQGVMVALSGQNEPTGQVVQRPPATEYFPAVHAVQLTMEVEAASEDVPAAQFSQTPATEYFPASQAVHPVESAIQTQSTESALQRGLFSTDPGDQ